MDLLRQDVRYALRRLAATPGFTMIAVLSLALGIGANTAMFSVINAILLRPLPVADVDRLVDLYTSDSGGVQHATSSYPDFRDMRALSSVFADATAWELFIAPVERGEPSPELVMGEVVSGSYFDVLGVETVLGRPFQRDEDAAPGAHPVAIIGHGYWQRNFGGNPAVIGSTLRLGSGTFTIIGVTPPGFAGMLRGIRADVFIPMAMVEAVKSGADRLEQRGSRGLFIKARLRDGVSLAQADVALQDLARRLALEHPETNEGRAMSALPTRDVAIMPIADRVLRPVALLLLAVVGLVLLIACANLAGFLLARAADRKREIAVRLALGAKRAQLVRQLLVESVALALLGGLAGIALAWIATRLLMGYQPPLPIPIQLDIPIDGRVLLYTLLVSVLAGVGFGMAPGLQATRPDVAPTLRDESGGTGARSKSRLRHGLVITQIAVCLVLLIASGLFLRSLLQAQRIDPGFDTSPAAIVRFVPGMVGYDDARGLAFFETLAERLRARADIDEVAMADRLPLGATVQTRNVNFDGMDPPAGRDAFDIDFANIDAAYFDVMQVPIIDGRGFSSADQAGAPSVAVVSQTLAGRFFPDGDAVGRTLYLGEDRSSPATVIGVAADALVRTLGEDPRPYLYLEARQTGASGLMVVARGRIPDDALLRAVRDEAAAIDPRIPALEAMTMEQHLALMLFPPRMAALLLSTFGALGLLLAAVGIWGVVSYAVARRTREVGIRMALGARPRDAVLLLTSGGARLVLIGAGTGILLAAAVSRLLSRYLFGVAAFDPLTFLGVPLLLALVGVGAAWLPARRAASIDPIRAIRSD
jgi:predicted permease